MPIEIRELIIKATVKEEETAATSSTYSANEAEKKISDINHIADKIAEIIKRKNER